MSLKTFKQSLVKEDEVVTPNVDNLQLSSSEDIKKFIALHKIKKTPDANGNKDNVFNASDEKYFDRPSNRFGYNPGEDKAVYESTGFENHPEAVEERTRVSRAAKTDLHHLGEDEAVGYTSHPKEEIEKNLSEGGWDHDYSDSQRGHVYTKWSNSMFHNLSLKNRGNGVHEISLQSSPSRYNKESVDEALHISSSTSFRVKAKSGDVKIRKYIAQLKGGQSKTVFAADENQAKNIAGKGVERLTQSEDVEDFMIKAFAQLNEVNQAKFIEELNDEVKTKALIKFAHSLDEMMSPDSLKDIYTANYDMAYTVLRDHEAAERHAQNYMIDYYDAKPEVYKKKVD